METLSSIIDIYAPVGSAGASVLFFALVIGHALADFPLQGEFLARAKNRHLKTATEGDDAPTGMWVVCLLAHSLIHAGAVWLVSGSVVLALVELILHTVIDSIRCDSRISFVTDQILHVLCKAGYVAVVFSGLLG